MAYQRAWIFANRRRFSSSEVESAPIEIDILKVLNSRLAGLAKARNSYAKMHARICGRFDLVFGAEWSAKGIEGAELAVDQIERAANGLRVTGHTGPVDCIKATRTFVAIKPTGRIERRDDENAWVGSYPLVVGLKVETGKHILVQSRLARYLVEHCSHFYVDRVLGGFDVLVVINFRPDEVQHLHDILIVLRQARDVRDSETFFSHQLTELIRAP